MVLPDNQLQSRELKATEDASIASSIPSEEELLCGRLQLSYPLHHRYYYRGDPGG